MGPRAGREVLTRQTLPACDAQDRPAGAAGQASGFRLHAGLTARADERDKLERRCRKMIVDGCGRLWYLGSHNGRLGMVE